MLTNQWNNKRISGAISYKHIGQFYVEQILFNGIAMPIAPTEWIMSI